MMSTAAAAKCSSPKRVPFFVFAGASLFGFPLFFSDFQ